METLSSHIKLNERDIIECEKLPAQVGYFHTAKFYHDKKVVGKESINYINETYDTYAFEGVIDVMLENMRQLSDRQRNDIKRYIAGLK